MAVEVITHKGKERYRDYPAGSLKVKHKDGLGVVYVSRSRRGTCVMGFVGSATKHAFYESYAREEDARKRVGSFFRNLTLHEQAVAERRIRSFSGHSFKVGDIVTNSWGYDQTNVDWYRVVRVSKNFVWLQPIAAQATDESAGPMAAYTTAAVDVSHNDPEKWGVVDLNKKVEKHKAEGESIRMEFGSGRKWSGEAVYESWGH